MDLNNFFVCALIYAMIAQFLPKSQVWKRVWFLEVYSKSGVENYNFFCLKWGQDSKNWAAHTRIGNVWEYPPCLLYTSDAADE